MPAFRDVHDVFNGEKGGKYWSIIQIRQVVELRDVAQVDVGFEDRTEHYLPGANKAIGARSSNFNVRSTLQ